jgi:PAS domain-containing protein
MTIPSPRSDSPGAAAIGRHFTPALAAALEAWLARQGALLAVKDAASGRYVYVNAGMARFLDRDADDVLGRSDVELVDPAAEHRTSFRDGRGSPRLFGAAPADRRRQR